ncbi:cell division protein FtsA [Mesosutterella sp. AGMB02718]|uniref:Cell division protein FtsA n=1 Tax=Mesosutterella faecium TaxID=2925194 RepID=A0ABT7IL47_9BURK|nr:cell division protein FtsA [Mesosutterella sp. AGMB02718]MDL2058638.1 cell division protein FtsA [Mesosutterella sp. AGMB02718]
MDKSNLLAALDVGTSKVAVIVAEPNSEGAVKICGLGSTRSEGVRSGVVVDIGAAVGSIRAAIDEAERTSGLHITDVYTACEDYRLRFVNNVGATPVRGPEIGQSDVDAAVANAKEVKLKSGEQVLKILIQEFAVDGEGGILKPMGMTGNRLEASIHVACGSPTTATNLLRCVRRSGVEVAHWTVPVWASAWAVLTPSERDLGVCLIDFGGGTVDVTVYIRNVVWFTAIVPLGGSAVTKDIAALYQLDEKAAELVKLRFGGADASRYRACDVINPAELLHADTPVGEARVIAQQELAEVIEARLREILKIVREMLKWTGLDQRIPAGVVFTGGVSQTEGFLKLARSVFEQHCRIGSPDIGQTIGGTGSSPAWSTAVGLLREAARDAMLHRKAMDSGKMHMGRGTWETIKRWFIGNY